MDFVPAVPVERAGLLVVVAVVELGLAGGVAAQRAAAQEIA